MPTLAGTRPKDNFPFLLQVDQGIANSLKPIEDGDGTVSALSISTNAVRIIGDNTDAALHVRQMSPGQTALVIENSDADSLMRLESDGSLYCDGQAIVAGQVLNASGLALLAGATIQVGNGSQLYYSGGNLDLGGTCTANAFVGQTLKAEDAGGTKSVTIDHNGTNGRVTTKTAGALILDSDASSIIIGQNCELRASHGTGATVLGLYGVGVVNLSGSLFSFNSHATNQASGAVDTSWGRAAAGVIKAYSGTGTSAYGALIVGQPTNGTVALTIDQKTGGTASLTAWRKDDTTVVASMSVAGDFVARDITARVLATSGDVSCINGGSTISLGSGGVTIDATGNLDIGTSVPFLQIAGSPIIITSGTDISISGDNAIISTSNIVFTSLPSSAGAAGVLYDNGDGIVRRSP